MSKIVAIILLAISCVYGVQSVEGYGVGTQKDIAKNMLIKDAMLKVLKSKGIDYDTNKDILENSILIEPNAYIESISIVKMERLSGFYSIKAIVNVRDDFLAQQTTQLLEHKTPPKEPTQGEMIEIKKPNDEKIQVVLQAVGYNFDDAKNIAKSMAYDEFAKHFDIRYSNLDETILPSKQLSKIVVAEFDILNQKEIRKGMYRIDVRVVLKKEKVTPPVFLVDTLDTNETAQ